MLKLRYAFFYRMLKYLSMRHNTPNRRNANKNKTQEISSNPKLHGRHSTQINAGLNQPANSAAKASEGAVDVLTFVGFKL